MALTAAVGVAWWRPTWCCPATWQWSSCRGQGGGQETAPDRHRGPGGRPGELVDRLRNTSTSPQAGPVIITYHDIGCNPSPYTVTPEDFAAQMRMIHDAGWTTLTAAQLDSLAAWSAGAAHTR